MTNPISDTPSPLEIHRILNLSTGHITESTADYLDADNDKLIVVYRKDDNGWIIYLDLDMFEESLDGAPDDLVAALRLAKANDCPLLCLDPEVNTVEELPVYEW